MQFSVEISRLNSCLDSFNALQQQRRHSANHTLLPNMFKNVYEYLRWKHEFVGMQNYNVRN